MSYIIFCIMSSVISRRKHGAMKTTDKPEEDNAASERYFKNHPFGTMGFDF